MFAIVKTNSTQIKQKKILISDSLMGGGMHMIKVKKSLTAVNQLPKSAIEGIPFVGPILGYVYEDFTNRQLSKFESKRVESATNYCINKIEQKIKDGFRPRDDDRFFANNENYRSNASEILEGVLLKCKTEHEQRKSNYISNLFVNIVFEKVTLDLANLLLKTVGTMTYRQLVLLNLFNLNKGNPLELSTKQGTQLSDKVSIYQEIFELTQLGLLKKRMVEDESKKVTLKDIGNINYNAMFGWDEVVPGYMELTSLGKEACKLLSLDEISRIDIENLVKQLK
jgi:hypothetical protein